MLNDDVLSIEFSDNYLSSDLGLKPIFIQLIGINYTFLY